MDQEDFSRFVPKAWHYVEDPNQAKLLADPKSLQYFGPFIGRERSAQAAAVEAHISVALMLYHIRRFLQAGLLMVARTEDRPGRAIRYYSAINDGFFVPFEVTPFATEEERLKSSLKRRYELTIRNAARVLREEGHKGRRIFRAANGDVVSESASSMVSTAPLDEPARAAAIDFDMDVRLTAPEAKALQKELYSLMKRYQQPKRKGKRYLLAATLLPLAD